MGWLDDLLGGTSRASVAGGMGAPVDVAALGLNALIAGGGYAGHKLGLLQTPPDLIEKPVGGSEWIADKMRGIGLLRDNPGSTGDNFGNAVGSVLVPLTAAKAPQIARGLLQMEANAAVPQKLSKQAGVVEYPKTWGGMTQDAYSAKQLDAQQSANRMRNAWDERMKEDLQSVLAKKGINQPPPTQRDIDQKALFSKFSGSLLSPNTARKMLSRNELNATPEETALLLKYIDENGNWFPRME